ncbi:MAG: hypothetical protein IJ518_04565 [Clostridia bacterium]|nr:hypothetical protein [Clostridia bacterium]
MKTVTPPSVKSAKETWIELLLDVLCSWMLAVSVCLLVDVQFPTIAGTPAILWHTALVTVVLALLTRKWWLLPATVGGGALVAFFWLLPWEELTAKLTVVKEFFAWWFSNLPLDSPWYTPETMHILHWLIHLAVSVGVFALLRLVRRSWPLVLVGGLLQAFIFLFANASNTTLSLSFYLVSVFPLLVRDRYSGRRMFSRRTRYQSMAAPRWSVSLLSGVLCAAVAVGMVMLLPGDTSGIRLRFCSDAVADLQTVSEWYTDDQRSNTEITLESLGLQPYRYRLGGDLVLPESKVLAVTDLKEETLLKVTTFDTFTGKKWTNSFEKGYRLDAHWPTEQAQYLNSLSAQNDRWAKFTDLLLPRKSITVTLTEPAYFLPVRGQVMGLTEHTPSKNALSFNARGDLLTYTYPQKAGYSYTMEVLDPDLSNYLPEPAYDAFTVLVMSDRDPLMADNAFYNHYVALPGNLSEDVRQRSYDVTDGVAVKLEAVLMLSRYFSLKDGYIYDENPGMTGYNDNVVDQLLRTKKGYCVHYATAMAMMTRAMGVPTRLAAGYKTVEQEGVQVVDAASPYVWVECYFDNVGWLSFDPTPGEGFNKPKEDKPQLEPPPPTDPPEPEELPEKPEEPFEKLDMPVYFEWVLPYLWLIPVILLIIRGCVAPRFYRLSGVRRRYKSTRRQAEHYYQDILRQLRCLGYPLGRGETLSELLARFGDGQSPETA